MAIVEGRDGDGEAPDDAEGRPGRAGDTATKDGLDLEGDEGSQHDRGDNGDNPVPGEGSEDHRAAPSHGLSLRRAAWAGSAVLGAAAVALAGALVAGGPSPASERAQVIGAARRFVVALTSYDYRTFGTSVATVEAMSTGAFAQQYQQTLANPAFRKALVANQAVATGVVTAGPFVASVHGAEADVFTVVHQQVTGKTSKAQSATNYIFTVLVDTTEGWKVDQVQLT